jgi:hypothetical protein
MAGIVTNAARWRERHGDSSSSALPLVSMAKCNVEL